LRIRPTPDFRQRRVGDPQLDIGSLPACLPAVGPRFVLHVVNALTVDALTDRRGVLDSRHQRVAGYAIEESMVTVMLSGSSTVLSLGWMAPVDQVIW
jgi:hypothetical protein